MVTVPDYNAQGRINAPKSSLVQNSKHTINEAEGAALFHKRIPIHRWRSSQSKTKSQ